MSMDKNPYVLFKDTRGPTAWGLIADASLRINFNFV
jgi:hypothetical protein